MSNILKSLNEATHRRYDNNRTGFSRGPRDDERHDLDVQKPNKEEWALKINGKVWSKDGNAVTFSSKEQALKARQSLLAKRPELEVGLVSRSVSESQLDELSNKKLGQYKTAAGSDATAADKSGDYKRGNKRMRGINNATKKEFDNDAKPKEVSENLGDELTSKSIQALMQAKQQNEKQRMAELEQWEKDFKQNTVAKFTARQPSFMQPKATPIAQPNEKHSVLKARLAQLNKAIEKQGILDKLVEKLEDKGLMTPTIEAIVDTSLLVKDGARDNYVELNDKLDNALDYVKNRLLTNKAAYAKPKSIDEEQLDELSCWSGYHRVAGTKAGFPGSCAKNKTNEEGVAEGSGDDFYAMALQRYPQLKRVNRETVINALNNAYEDYLMHYGYEGIGPDEESSMIDHAVKGLKQGVAEEQHSCPHCGGELVSEELMNEKKDACYYKVKSRYKVWPSAYASGALVKCRKKGADSWGNGGKKNESSILEGIEQVDENLHQWFKEKWVRFGPDGKIRGDCARGDDSEGKPKCLPQSKAQNLGKKGRASAAARKRREDPNPERSGKAINVNTKKKANEEALDEKWSQKYKDSINCSNPKGFSQKAHCAGKKK